MKEAYNEILRKHVELFRSKFGQCVDSNLSMKVRTLIKIMKDEQQQDKAKKILIFVYERRIVRYLQKLLEQYLIQSDIP